jgi:hypothetical protein
MAAEVRWRRQLLKSNSTPDHLQRRSDGDDCSTGEAASAVAIVVIKKAAAPFVGAWPTAVLMCGYWENQ